MTKSKKLIALLVVLAMVMTLVLAACGSTHECADQCPTCGKCLSQCEEKECSDKCAGHQGGTTHECADKCPTCQKCTTECTDPACAQKCQGHQQGGTHTCTSKCPTCQKCTNTSCQETACTPKCQGHQGEETCEHASIVLNKCQNCTKEFTATEILDAVEALAAGNTTSNTTVKLNGTYRLSGIVSSIPTAFDSSFGNVTIVFAVDGDTKTRTIQAYRLVGTDEADAKDIVIGSQVTVTGELGDYNNYSNVHAQQFVQGCKLESLTQPEYSLTWEIEEHGSVASKPETAKSGQEITFSVTCDAGYKVGEVRVNGSVKTAETDGSYKFVVTGAMTISVGIVSNETKTAEELHKISFNTSANGGDVTVNNNQYDTAQSSYKDMKASKNGFALTMVGFSNNNGSWTNMRCGRSAAAHTASISTDNAVANVITKVIVNIENITEKNANSCTKFALQISSTSDFAEYKEVTATMAKGDIEFNIATENQGANLYYRIVVEANATGQNGSYYFSTIAFWGYAA